MADSAEVSTHFRIPILSGQSTFTVRVPHHHLQGNRKFYFSQLNLVPEYFSIDAEKEKLDADPDLEQTVTMDVQVTVKHGDPKTLYSKDGYTNKESMSNTADAIVNLNNFFESKKPSFAQTSPMFIDWVDRIEQKTMDIETYVIRMAGIYYNKDYEAQEHLDFIPHSVRGVHDSNNYKLPLGLMKAGDAFNKRIRLRLWLAPYTKVVFSSKDPFVSDFGFLEKQLGTFSASKKQYHLTNDTGYYVPAIIAENPPNVILTRANFKINVGSSSSSIVGSIRGIQMNKKDWLDNEKLAEALTEKFKLSSRMTNTVFAFGYDKPNKKFVFNFPDSDQVGVIIQCEPEFAHRLGFGTNTIIMKGMQALPQEDRYSIFDAKKKALTVVYDTGPILCTLDQMSSNTTSGALDHYMAALYPHNSGILCMPQSVCSCSSNLTPIYAKTLASAAHVPITFRLLRIYEDQSISDFAWKCNGYIYGVLQGTCKKV
jgi:hypothetical protein